MEQNCIFKWEKSNSQGVCILINDEFNCDVLNYFNIVNAPRRIIFSINYIPGTIFSQEDYFTFPITNPS